MSQQVQMKARDFGARLEEMIPWTREIRVPRETSELFTAQGDQGVNPSGAVRWNVTGEQRDHRRQQGNAVESDWSVACTPHSRLRITPKKQSRSQTNHHAGESNSHSRTTRLRILRCDAPSAIRIPNSPFPDSFGTPITPYLPTTARTSATPAA
jgi:hypothetical protein